MLRTLALALCAPLLLSTACASEADHTERDLLVDPGDAELVALRGAPDAAAEAGSARFEMTFSFDGPDGPVEMVATGAYDRDRLSMELDLGSLLQDLGGAAGGAAPAGFDAPMQVVVSEETVYLRVPLLEALTGTSGWLSAAADELGAGADALGVTGATTHPARLLETLRGITADLDGRGEEEVRGVTATRYAGTIDLDDVLAGAPADERAQLEAELDQLGAPGSRSVPVEVWIDADGLVRRLSMRFDGIAADEGPIGVPGSATMTLELFDFGLPVEVELPAPGEVTPMSDVLPELTG